MIGRVIDFRGCIAKGSVAIVNQQAIVPQASQIEVNESVLIRVAGGKSG